MKAPMIAITILCALVLTALVLTNTIDDGP